MDRQYGKLYLFNLVIACIAIVLLTGSFILYLVKDFEEYRSGVIEELQIQASSAAGQVDSLVNGIHITMKLMDGWIAVNPDRDPRFDPDFIRMVEVFRDHAGNMIDIRIVSEQGGLYYFPSESTIPLADVSDREYFRVQKTRSSGALWFAPAVKSRVTGVWGIPVSYRLQKNRHELLVLFAAIEFRNFDRMFEPILEDPERSILIIRDDHLVLSCSPFEESLVGRRFKPLPRNQNNTVFAADTPDKIRRIMAWKKLDGLPVYVVLSDNYDLLLRRWQLKAVSPVALFIIFMAGFVYLSIKSLKQLRKLGEYKIKLEKAARIDSLTGMKNRNYFIERVTGELKRARRNKTRIILLMADIDHFKAVNDAYGHPAGDEILKRMAGVFNKGIRGQDLAGRVGGEEFAILLTDTGPEQGREIAERIRIKAAEITWENWQCHVSIGGAEWLGEGESLDELYKRADEALYQAKRTGRNKVVMI